MGWPGLANAQRCASVGSNSSLSSGFTSNGSTARLKPTSPDVERCGFEGNQAGGRGGAVAVDSGTASLRGVTMLTNSANQGGALAVGSATATLLASTLVRNDATAAAGGISANGAQLDIGGCILWANTIGLLRGGQTFQLATSGASPRIDYTCVEGWNGSLGGTGNIATDPRLADLLAGDLHLTSGSPCIDAFAAPPTLPTVDIDGQPRRLCDYPDLGADEFGDPAGRIFGSSCGGDISLTGTPRIGATYSVGGWTPTGGGMLFLGLSASLWGGTLPLPFDMTPFGAIGCLVWVSPDLELYRGAVSTSPFNPTSISIPLPNQPSLVCRTLYHQWFFWLPPQPLTQFHSSQAAEVRIGF